MSANLFHKNRPFFVRMRDQAFAKALQKFSEMEEKVKQMDVPEKERLRSLDQFIQALETAFDYASDSIRGLKRKHLKMYREDSAFGVLEEEVVLCHFLEEMLSSTRFLQARLNTDLKMRLYQQRLRRIQSQVPQGDGFISTILFSVEKFQETELVAISKVLELMGQRWLVGKGLFEIIRQKLQHWVQPATLV
jgi:hypothetical protein